MLKVLIVEPERKPYVKEIGDELKDLQRVVGGRIECVYVDDVALVVNEEGKFNGTPFNRAIYDEDGNAVDYIFGTFFICGLGDDDFTDLPDDEIEQFTKLYSPLEYLIRINGKLIYIVE